MDVTEAPPPQPVDITPVVLGADALEVAAEAVADALQAPAPAPNASPPPPPTQIKSTIAFPVAVQDVAAITSADSPERAAFATSFKDGMAASLGGGDAVSRDDIIIDAITSGSVNVEFHIEVPSTVAQDAADMVATLADDASAVEVTVGGEAIAATQNSMTEPTVFEVQPQDCLGMFSQCTTACRKTYKITAVQSGIGENCAAPSCADPTNCMDGEEATCDDGEGDCPPTVQLKAAGSTRAAVHLGAAMVLFASW